MAKKKTTPEGEWPFDKRFLLLLLLAIIIAGLFLLSKLVPLGLVASPNPVPQGSICIEVAGQTEGDWV